MDGDRSAPLPTRVETLPSLPPTFGVRLDAGLAALRLSLAPVQRSAIEAHVQLLLAWNAAINLTAIVDPAEIAVRHVLDSLAAVPILRQRRAASLIDLGSGGGFPAIPLAIAVPLERALLVESTAKKARFLEAAATVSGLSGRVVVAAERAEVLARRPEHRDRWRVVTARALASLPELVELAFPLLAPGGCLVAWKRGDLAVELTAAERAVDALGGGQIETFPVAVGGLVSHCLVVATARGPAPDRFPRDPAVRRRRPW